MDYEATAFTLKIEVESEVIIVAVPAGQRFGNKFYGNRWLPFTVPKEKQDMAASSNKWKEGQRVPCFHGPLMNEMGH